MKYNVHIFNFVTHTLGVMSKNLLANPRSQKFTFIFFFLSFMLWSFAFKSLFHFEGIFAYGVSMDPTSFFVRLVHHSLLKRPSFPYWTVLALLPKNQLAVDVWVYFWIQFYSIGLYVSLYASTTLFRFLVSFEIEKCVSSYAMGWVMSFQKFVHGIFNP